MHKLIISANISRRKLRMRSKKLTRAFAVAMTAAMVMGQAMSVCAAETGTGSGTGNGSGTTTHTTSVSSGTSSSSTEAVVDDVINVTTDTVSVGGATFKTTVNGIFYASSVNGFAFMTPAATIGAAYGLTGNEKLFASVWNMDQKKSTAAMASFNAAAAILGGQIGPCLDINLGKLSSGKFTSLSSDGADVTIGMGIPKSFLTAGATYKVICVRAGGAVTVLDDLDTDDATVTVNIKGGLGAYALVKIA